MKREADEIYCLCLLLHRVKFPEEWLVRATTLSSWPMLDISSLMLFRNKAKDLEMRGL